MVRLVEQSDASNLVSILKLAPNHRVDHLVPYWLESLECRLEVNLDFTTSLVHFILPCGDHTTLEQRHSIDPRLILFQLYATQDKSTVSICECHRY